MLHHLLGFFINDRSFIFMRIATIIASSFIALLPLSSYAVDITISNLTSSVGTGKISGICSNILGPSGVIHPGQSLVVPQIVFDLYCMNQCTADLYLSDNCSGERIASANIDESKGILDVTPYDHEGKFTINHNATNVTIVESNH